MVIWKGKNESEQKDDDHKGDDCEISRRDREGAKGKIVSRMV